MRLYLGIDMIFDIHTHIVPGVDDGSRSFEESVKMIELANSQGVTSIISTSHYYARRPSDPNVIRESVERLNELLPQISIYPGNEVMYFEGMEEKLSSGEILTMANSRFVLVEFYPNESYKRMMSAIRGLRYAGYLPIIAHAERYTEVKEKGLSELIDLGAYIQITFEPVGETILQSNCRFLRKALKEEEVHFLGSDMHRIDKRPPVLSKAIKWIWNHIENAEDVFYHNARHIIENHDFLNDF